MENSSIIVSIVLLLASGMIMILPNTYSYKGHAFILFLIVGFVLGRGLYKNYKEKGRLIL